MKRKLLSLGLAVVLLLTLAIPAAAAESAPFGDSTASADDFNAAEFEEVSDETPMMAEPVEYFEDEDIEYLDEDDLEDFEDFEYEEDEE